MPSAVNLELSRPETTLSAAMSDSPHGLTAHRPVTLAAAGLVLAGLAAYARCGAGAFVLDDQSSVVTNASLRQVWPPWAPLLAAGAGGTRGRPVANLSFAWNHALGGLNPAGYHWTNLLIHLLAGLILFGILRRTFLSPRLAPQWGEDATFLGAILAAVWLVHPLTTETVVYVAQRTEGLMGLCYLSALYCLIRGATAASGRGWYAGAVFATFAGVATKESMVTAPVVLFLYDRTFLGGSFKDAWRERGCVYVGLAASWLLLAVLMGRLAERGAGLGAGVSPLAYAVAESEAIARYLKLSLWPHPLVFDYGPALPHGHAWATLPFVLVLVAGLVVALIRWPAVGFALCWVLGILAPTSSVIPVALQPVAENRMYLPLIGVVVLVGAGLYRLSPRVARPILVAGIVILGALTFERVATYRTAVGLWTDTVAKRPFNPRAHASLGNALLADGHIDAGLRELEAALRLDPSVAEIHLDLGVAEANLGHFDQANGHVLAALHLSPALPEAHYDQGWLAARSGHPDQALADYDAAIALRPDYADAHVNAASLLVQAGRFAEAIPEFEAALAAGEPDADLYFNLAYARIKTGQLAGAIADYRKALELKPDFAAARQNLQTLEALGRKPAGTH